MEHRRGDVNLANSALLTDLYQLNMMQAYLARDEVGTAVFEFFVRDLPSRRGFLIAAGLDQVLEYLEDLHFTSDEIAWLAAGGRFGKPFLQYLESFRFTGDVHAMAEGTAFFPNEPVLRVTAPLPEAQIVETRIINLLHFQSLIAAKAARMVLAAPGKLLVDFGLRRAHGAEAGLLAARAGYLTGFAGTATMLAGKLFDIPLFGTMAHSFIQAHDNELEAFENFARARPDRLVLLIDTYDTEMGARRVVELAPRLRRAGIKIDGVRLDSGDLIGLSKRVRRILDEGGLKDTTIFASGGLDEDDLIRFMREKAPVDGFGVGTSLTTSSDVPAIDCAYKLEEYKGVPRRKLSSGKATWPGRKQVWRRFDADGRMIGDILSTDGDPQPGEPLLQQVMRGGRRILPREPLAVIRERVARELERLPEPLRRLEGGVTYPVHVSEAVRKLAAEFDARLPHEAKGQSNDRHNDPRRDRRSACR